MTTRLPVLPELPAMRCDAHCRRCCSETVPVSEAELEAVVLYANERDFNVNDAPELCPFYDLGEGRCGVYEARPLVCRVLGHDPACRCDLGYDVPMSQAQARGMGAAFREVGPPTRFLHEVRGGGRAEVHPDVWRFVNDNRKRAGLPPLQEGAST